MNTSLAVPNLVAQIKIAQLEADEYAAHNEAEHAYRLTRNRFLTKPARLKYQAAYFTAERRHTAALNTLIKALQSAAH